MKSVKRVSWKGRGSCPQYEFERVLNLDEVEIVHTSYSTLLWTEWLSRLVVHREWVKFTMGVDFAKFWKMSKLERMQNKKEGSVLSMDLKGFWILKRSSFGWGPMVESNVLQPCFPPQSLETRVDLLWKGSLWKIWKTQSPKRVKGKGRGSCPQLEFERVLNLEEVDPKSICMGGSNVHQPCFPSRSLDHWGSVLWEVGNVKNAKSEKGERERKRK